MKKLLKNKFIYVMLGLAVAVIAVSGFVSRIRDFNTEMEEYAGGYSIDVIDEYEYEEPVAFSPKPTEAEPSEVYESVQEETPQETVAASMKPVAIALPVQGELLEEHSNGELVYNKTMEDWRTHNGIDIAAEVGTAVKAAADGVVTSAGYDGMYGFCITIDHGGFVTKYCGLQESDIISENTDVKAGDVIGGIGLTAEIETAETPHLHFELIKDEKSVNPLEFVENNVL